MYLHPVQLLHFFENVEDSLVECILQLLVFESQNFGLLDCLFWGEVGNADPTLQGAEFFVQPRIFLLELLDLLSSVRAFGNCLFEVRILFSQLDLQVEVVFA